MFRVKPVSLIQRICSNSMRSNTRFSQQMPLLMATMNTQYRSFAGDATLGGKLPGGLEPNPPSNPQSDNPHLYDPDYVPTEEGDFDVDPQSIRVRQPLPKENFIPREEVMKRIIAVCEGMERCQTEGKVITENSHLVNDLGLDSLDQVEFGLALEDEFDVEIPDDEAEQIVTLGDAIDLLADHPHAR